MRFPARLVLAPLLALSLVGCDAGNRAEPGAENTLGAPQVTVSTPYEGQVVVRSRQGASVLAKLDVTGALGRNAGATLRYRLVVGTQEGPWTPVADASKAVELGDLKPTGGEDVYVLEVEVLDKAGVPYTTRTTTGADAAIVTKVSNASATCRRSFKVADGWQ